MDKFAVHHRIIGETIQHKVASSHIAVIGVGGLGCSVAQGLVRLGVQHITLIDNDMVQQANLPRQVLFDETDIGAHKVDVAKCKLLLFSKDINVITKTERLTKSNGSKLLTGAEIVMDCTDNPESRYFISEICKELSTPMVYGGVNQFEGQISVFNYEGSPSFHEAFPNKEELINQPNCQDSGVLPFVVQGVANRQVIEAYKIITKDKDLLNNRLLCISFLSGRQRIISLINEQL